MKFEYKLRGAGWANFNIKKNSQSFSFSPGFQTDALGGILNALKVIHPIFDPEGIFKENGSYYTWDAEPEILDWNLKYIDNGNLLINLTYIDGDEEDGEVVLNEVCNYDLFLNEVLREAELILAEYGIVGYKEMWYENEFPLSTFLELKYYLEKKNRFPIVTNRVGRKKTNKSDLKFELDFINKII